MTLNFEQLQSVWNLHKKLDDLLENLQFNQKSLKETLEEVFVFLKNSVSIAALFVETQNEKLINTVFAYGACDESLKLRAPQLSTVNKIVTFTTPGAIWFGQSIDVDNHIIGTIAIGIKNTNKHIEINEEYYSTTLNTISELLDTYIYSKHCSSIKHSMIMGLQEAMADLDISKSLFKAAQILYQSIKFSHMLIVYTDKEITTNSRNIKYIYLKDNKLINDSSDSPLPEIDRCIRSTPNFLTISPSDLCKTLHLNNVAVSYLTKGIDVDDSIGFIALECNHNEKISILAQELIQIFSEELRQRLIDLNREKNNLRKYFPNPIIDKLITTDDYEYLYLSPRATEIGILFADISGFTKMSEQALESPERITHFVNRWAKGVVARVFPLGATLDKLIGDCVMLLFGPPFYDKDESTIIRHMLQASKQILKFTQRYLNSKENRDIQKHPDFERFGVSIGVNFGKCVVGLIGPNQDLTAFSSEVNKTARLQGLAKANQILVSERVKEIATKDCKANWLFSGKQTAQVKNIANPIDYYELVTKKSQ